MISKERREKLSGLSNRWMKNAGTLSRLGRVSLARLSSVLCSLSHQNDPRLYIPSFFFFFRLVLFVFFVTHTRPNVPVKDRKKKNNEGTCSNRNQNVNEKSKWGAKRSVNSSFAWRCLRDWHPKPRNTCNLFFWWGDNNKYKKIRIRLKGGTQ